MTYGVPLDVDKALNWPIAQVAIHLLRGFKRGGATSRYNFKINTTQAYQQNGIRGKDLTELTNVLLEAFDWLILHGLLTEGTQNGEWPFVSRKGLAVLQQPDPIAYVTAEARLNIDLHPLIARRVQNQFLLGEYELGALAAMREVEIRVRELAEAKPGDIGVALMKQAFSPKEPGPLTDSNAEKGEQEAMMALFWGAIGVFKNPVSHRQVEYDDPTLASEVILLADLLLRILDQRQSAMAAG